MQPVGARRTFLKTGAILALVVGAVFAGFPVFWMLSSSFKSNSEIFLSPPEVITDHFSLDAYRSIFSDSEKVRFFINSYIVALSVTALTLSSRSLQVMRSAGSSSRASGSSTSPSSACRRCRRSRF